MNLTSGVMCGNIPRARPRNDGRRAGNCHHGRIESSGRNRLTLEPPRPEYFEFSVPVIYTSSSPRTRASRFNSVSHPLPRKPEANFASDSPIRDECDLIKICPFYPAAPRRLDQSRARIRNDLHNRMPAKETPDR